MSQGATKKDRAAHCFSLRKVLAIGQTESQSFPSRLTQPDDTVFGGSYVYILTALPLWTPRL